MESKKRIIDLSVDYIYEHINEPLVVKNVAEQFNFSEYYFNRVFKEVTGESVYALIKRIKLEQSAIALKTEKDRSITDIGLDYGYEVSNYSTAFKKQMAVGPAGYQAISQSEKSIIERQEFCVEEKATPLPHKKIAVLSGLGWIGKNNLLVTEKYGCALCMCTLLTDMPLEVVSEKIQEVRCGNCQTCKKICPTHVIKGTKWTASIVRDEIVDVYKCETCLKCMAYCGFSQKYSRVE